MEINNFEYYNEDLNTEVNYENDELFDPNNIKKEKIESNKELLERINKIKNRNFRKQKEEIKIPEVINNKYIIKQNNNIYIHNTEDCIINNNNNKQYNFDYIKCKNNKCKHYYCIYCYKIFMKYKSYNNKKCLFYNNNNKYYTEYPFIYSYNCYGCKSNIPFIDKKNCCFCNNNFVGLINDMNKYKCFECDNYMCQNCIETKTNGYFGDNAWCTKC